MYLSHYSLNEKPFQINPDPKFLWLGEAHKEALATLKYGIQDNRGLLLLVGDVGTGKTTLINKLLNTLDDNTLVATILDPGLEKLDFYNFLAQAFKMDKKYTSKGDFLVHFIHFLHKAHSSHKKVLLIIDEAHVLTNEMLEEIRLLSNIERQNEKLLNIFFVGQNELNDNLAETRNRALLQRITSSYNVDPLKKNEVGEYIQFRLSVAGREEKIFNSGAVRQIISFSKCYPRLINIICDHALLTGYVKGKKEINAAILKESAKDLGPLKESWKEKKNKHQIKITNGGVQTVSKKSGLRGFVYILCAALLVFAAGYFYFQSKYDKHLVKIKDTEIALLKKHSDSPTSSKKTLAKDAKRKIPEPESEPEIEADNQKGYAAEKKKQDTEDNKKKSFPLPLPDQKYIINFTSDSNELTVKTYELLNQLVEITTQNPGTEIVIEGYTDSTGSYSYNKSLSLFRANIVKNYFVGKGINPAAIKTFGMGPENPLESNAIAQGRKANRRVEVKLKLP